MFYVAGILTIAKISNTARVQIIGFFFGSETLTIIGYSFFEWIKVMYNFLSGNSSDKNIFPGTSGNLFS